MRSSLAWLTARRLLLTGTGSLLLLLFAGSAFALAAGVLDQEQDPSNAAVCVTATPFRAQTFTADVSGLLDAFEIVVVSGGSGTFSVTAVDGTGKPTGPALGSGTAAAIGNSQQWIHFDLGAAVPVVAGTKYAIVSDSCLAGILYWSQADGTDSYAGGAPYLSADGSAWAAPSASISYTDDFSFKTYVEPETTTTITSVDHSPSVVGEAVTIGVSVTPTGVGVDSDDPAGDILVQRGAGSCHIAAPSGSCSITPTSAGSASITATYSHVAKGDGTGEFQDSNATPQRQQVEPADVSLSISNATELATPSVVGESYTVRWHSSVVPPGNGTPTGNVTISGGSSCHAEISVGQCTLTSTSAGTKSLSASYAGDTDFKSATSSAVSHTVNPADTSTSITSDTNPADFGQSVTFTASVTVVSPGSGTPKGSVEFQSDGTDIGGCAAKPLDGSGQASCSTSSVAVGHHAVSASYSGDSDHDASTKTLTQQVNLADVSLSVSNGAELATPSVVGQSYTVKWQSSVVSPGSGTPTGDVTVSGGSSCRADISVGQCTLTSTSAGTKSLSASYAGDANFGTATSGSVSHTVDQADTVTTLTSVPQPADFGQSVTFTARVTVVPPGSGTPTGSVEFQSDGSDISGCASVSLDGSGQARCSTSSVAIGHHTIKASYSGDSDFNPSSDGLGQQVRRVATSVTLRTSPEPSVHGQAVRLFAQVSFTAPAPVSRTPTGTVTFRRAGRVLCANVPIDATGHAVCGPLTGLPTGADRLRVSYSGDATFRPGTSRMRIHDVDPAPTTTRVSALPDPTSDGATVRLSATVTTQAPGHGIPDGSVQFVIDGHRVAPQAALVNGHATLTINLSLRSGDHALRAFYVGSPDFAASSSATWPLIVQ